MTGQEPDDPLRARLRRADPAASLPPLGGDRVDRMLEDVVGHDTTTESRESGTRGRSPFTWVVAAAAALVIAGVGVLALTGGDPATPPPAAQPDPTVTELTLPATAPGRCLVPNAQTLAGAAHAVDGEVTGVTGTVATLAVSRWYASEPTDELRVDAVEAGRTPLIGAPTLEVGDRYLLAATRDGDLLVCGFSAPYSSELAALYADAFGA
ncbi:hypothetical protein [Nocardioides coralli]|uniref:hypothetical protein n=1 Tax=Nocardioides coralli TaxID=2872154 RepID=UPI001CA3ECDE|nr:hypothetical protein [Nocardioides coralli]QZY28697.1 hypothetical protein K6T13_14715 [Nocardioides coralli]